MTKLVIVESPTKIKSLEKYLPAGFKVTSCVGHIRDLPSKKSETPKAIRDEPWADYAIDVDDEFQPHYVMIRGKSKVIAEIKKHLKNADELYLATDEDREGESISWHLVEVLKPKVPVRRMVFNEITKEAIVEALESPREVDENLVQAQETRRILDRLYGYTLSPLLWKKIGGSLSAGRVQSVAVRLIVQRERERHAFRAGTYWDITARLAKAAAEFDAKLVTVDGTRIATSKDFDKDTGRIMEGRDVLLLEEERARELERALRDATWRVATVESAERQSKPAPPFITSTLQQEANNRLNLSARETMRVAQRLYENGFITYMRTDSTHLSEEALSGARKAIEAEFGANYLSPQPRVYKGKQAKGAQEAHEAIRPAGGEFKHPDTSGLRGREGKLYELIWRRTLASQMPNERFTSTTVTLEAAGTTFTASGKRVEFPGYRAAYPIQGRETPELPELAEGDVVDLRELTPEGHETKPPARYTEATLVRALEDDGVGRPSTYADIIARIQDKGYVVMRGKALVPTFTAFAVTGFLEKHFPNLVDEQFTAGMESTLDAIAAGEAEPLPYLKEFFHGPDGLKAQVEAKQDSIDPAEARVIEIEGLPATVRIGRFGPYLEAEHDGESVNASVPETVTPDELTPELVNELVEEKAKGPESIGTDPETGKPVYLLSGRFGPYFQLGDAEGDEKPPRASVPKDMAKEDVSLEEALFLLKLPRELGEHPDGGRVIAGLGRYGPYVGHEREGERTEYRSLKDMDQLRSIELAEGLQLLSQPKARGRRQATVLKEVGNHPDDGEPVRVLDGRYGPYVKHGSTNATLPKGTDPSAVTLEQAVDLVAERAARKPKKKKKGKAKGKRKKAKRKR